MMLVPQWPTGCWELGQEYPPDRSRMNMNKALCEDDLFPQSIHQPLPVSHLPAGGVVSSGETGEQPSG